mmetsp:Transcript_25153/g.25352  ORF Transcript_25153/g.25352 Transcript_25153/m.25352 type:complete len:101 (-) Transcript_25153:154-456(-)
MAETDKKHSSERNFVAEQHNWEQRVKAELESATKWNENWGVLYTRDIPNDYDGRIKYLEDQIKSKKQTTKNEVLRGGLGYKENSQINYRRKKLDFETEII